MKRLLVIILMLVSCVSYGAVNPHVTSIDTVATIAALRALAAPASTKFAIVRGYSSVSDGGGGVFYFDTEATNVDDGGHYIRPSSNPATGRWVRDTNRKVVNVRHFGAMGDATIVSTSFNATVHNGSVPASYTGDIHTFTGTDDTNAFIRARAVMSSGKSLYIPSGRYRINGNAAGWIDPSYIRPGFNIIDKEDVVIRGDGPSSKLCVSYDASGETSIDTTFSIFHFLGCTRSGVKDISIDMQVVGWPDAQVSADDNDTRLISAISIGHSGPTEEGGADVGGRLPAKDCFISHVDMRVNHPWGAYFGDPYATSPVLKRGAKLFATYVYGLIGSYPTALTTVPSEEDIMAQGTTIDFCKIHDGQAYPVFLWMTEGTTVVNNSIPDHGGQIPALRVVHLNCGLTIEDNTIGMNPSYSDGSRLMDGIFVSNDSSFFVPNNITISGNHITCNQSYLGGITVLSGTKIAITTNTLSGKDAKATPSIGSYGGITVRPPATWAKPGDAGQVGDIGISNNFINGFDNGIMCVAFRPTISKNDVSDVTTYGVYVMPIGAASVSLNQVNGAGIGLNIPRNLTVVGGTYVATGTCLVSTNSITSCGYGLLGEYAANTFTSYKDNCVIDCATGTANIVGTVMRYEDNYAESNTVDADTSTLGVASPTFTYENGIMYGNP